MRETCFAFNSLNCWKVYYQLDERDQNVKFDLELLKILANVLEYCQQVRDKNDRLCKFGTGHTILFFDH